MIKVENGSLEVEGNTKDVICDLAFALGAIAREMGTGEENPVEEAEEFISVVVGATRFWLNKKGIRATMDGIASHFADHDHE